MVATTVFQVATFVAFFAAFFAFAVGAFVARFIALRSEAPVSVDPCDSEEWIASVETSLDLAEIDAEWLDLVAKAEIAETVRVSFVRNAKRAIARATIRRMTVRVERARLIRDLALSRLSALTLDALSQRDDSHIATQDPAPRLTRNEGSPMNRKTFDHFHNAVDQAIEDLRAAFPRDEECPETLRCPPSAPVSEKPILVRVAS